MPVLVLEGSDPERAVGFRCDGHRDVPLLNQNADAFAECAVCCMDQAVDASIGKLGEILDSAAIRLDFYEPGAGDNLRQKYAEWLQGIGG